MNIKTIKFILIFISIILCFNLLITMNKNNKISTNFSSYTNNLFKEFLHNNSMDIHFKLVHPEHYGLKDVKPKMESLSKKSFLKNVNFYKQCLKNLKTYNYNTLSQDEKLTYDILNQYFTTEITARDYYYHMEVLSPTLGIQTSIPIFFAEYKLCKKTRINDYLNLLSEIPMLFNKIIKFEQDKAEKGFLMPDYAIDDVNAQINNFLNNINNNMLIEVFNKKINNITNLSKKEKKYYKSKNKQIIINKILPSYKKLQNNLTLLKGKSKNNNGLYYLKNGKNYYTYLYKSYTGSSLSIENITHIIDNEITNGINEMINLSTNSNVIQAYKNINSNFKSVKEIIIFLKNNMTNSFSNIQETNLMIKYVHPSLQEFMSPAFYLLSPIDEINDQVIYINNSKHLEINEKLYETLAHESYPGHLYQYVYFRKEPVPLIRHLLNFEGYSEGWAVYAQTEAIKFINKDKDLQRLLQLDSILSLLIMARIDIGIHYNGWTYEEVQKYLSSNFPEVDAYAIFKSTVEEPANILKYVVGYLEIIRLKKKAINALEDKFDEKAFHDFILKIGPAPYQVIEKQLDKWIIKNKTIDVSSLIFY